MSAAARLTRELAERAAAEGLVAFGVAPVAPLERDRARLADWLSRGRQASMTWMEDVALRTDPGRLLPECRFVVAVGMSYWTGAPSARGRGQGRVARYAQGRDYHRVLGKRLRRLATWLDERSGSRSRGVTDSAPVLERAWARRAGLGWIGKNSNLLTRSGSWLLLGEVLTTADLRPTGTEVEDLCGSCTACLDACPTEALVDDGVLDAERCISYWTIEHRGPVPPARREGIGDWLFGCDVCQDVCPWNGKFPRVEPEGAFEPRDDLAGLDPEAILAMDEAEFRRRFSGTPLMRAKWQGMRRNACIVLGNSGDASRLAALAAATDDPDPVVADHARWAIGRIESLLKS